MKKFFKKLVGRGNDEVTVPAVGQNQPEEVKMHPPCQPDAHRDLAFTCFKENCSTRICNFCAPPMNADQEIICKLCALSAANLGDMAFSSDEEETKAFSGTGMTQIARVSFDPHSSQTVGWDSIWAIIEGEDKEKDAFKQKLDGGVTDYIKKSEEEER